MSSPIATPADLSLFLGLTVDDARATFLLGLAQDRCEAKVSPLPATAKGVVCAVAGRAYINATNVSQQTFGPYTVRSTGGITLTPQDKAALRDVSGRTLADSFSMLPDGQDAIFILAVVATTGTFTLGFAGVNTVPLAYNADPVTVQNALVALPTVNTGNAQVTGAAGQYTIEFIGTLGTMPVTAFSANGDGLAGGTATLTTQTQGTFGPGQGLPVWDSDYWLSYRYLLGQPSLYSSSW